MSGTLILCATPIGNLGDTSTRLAETLAAADVIYAEDTRRTAKLLAHLGVSKPMRSYFAGNERSRNTELADDLADGKVVALVSDAGMPAVSDPGASAVQVAIEAGATVTAIPGPSAPVTAVAIAGFGGDRYVFEGFLPRKGRERATRLASIASDERTTVFFCAPKRVGKDLTDLGEWAMPDRRVVVTRELTKIYEEVWRGTLSEAVVHWVDGNHRGEFTVVIEGAESVPADLASAIEQVRALTESGEPTSSAVKAVAASTGVRKNDLYDAMTIGDVEEPG